MHAVEVAQRIAGRQCGHLNPGDPAFRQAQNPLQLGRREALRVGAGQIALGFFDVETQGVGVDFKQLIVRLQTAQRQRRNTAAAHQQVETVGSMLQQLLKVADDAGVVEQVQVIEHQVQGVLPGLHQVDQLADKPAVGQREALGQGRHRLQRFATGLAQGRQHIAAKGLRGVVLLIQAEPRHAVALLQQMLAPLPQQRGFAKPGGPAHQRHAAFLHQADFFQQACPCQHRTRRARRYQFGADQR